MCLTFGVHFISSIWYNIFVQDSGFTSFSRVPYKDGYLKLRNGNASTGDAGVVYYTFNKNNTSQTEEVPAIVPVPESEQQTVDKSVGDRVAAGFVGVGLLAVTIVLFADDAVGMVFDDGIALGTGAAMIERFIYAFG